MDSDSTPSERPEAPKVVFIHTPKTAGSSVWFAADWKKRRMAKSHYDVRFWIDHVGLDEWSGYDSFAVVRHPLDRLVSIFGYNFQRQRTLSNYDSMSLQRFREWVVSGREVRPGLELPVCPGDNGHTERKRWITETQIEWLCDHDGKLAVKHTLRFEKLDEMWPVFSKMVGFDKPITKNNASKRRGDWRVYYDDKTEAIAREIYARDFEILGYD